MGRIALNIIEHKIENGMLYVKTDDKDNEYFTYFADKFDSKEQLLSEIGKKIAMKTKKNSAKKAKIAKLESELNA